MRKFLSCLLFVAVFAIFSQNALAADWKMPNGAKPFSFDSGLKPTAPCGANVASKLQPTFIKAAKQTGVKWQILAAITKVESDFGCNLGPSSAGATGWTQFMPDTWERWGMDADGDGEADPSNSVDAVYSTARYLRASGAPEDYKKAIFAYNHADWYVSLVLKTSKTFSKVSQSDFQQVSELSRYARKLENDVKASKTKLKSAKKVEKTMLKKVRQGQAQYRIVSKAAQQAQKQSVEQQKNLAVQTDRYINLTSQVSTNAKPQNGDENVLNYIASSNSQDAVLVYQSASVMLDQQNDALKNLRKLSIETNQKTLQAQQLVQKQNDLNRQKVTNLLTAQANKKDRQNAFIKIRKDQKTYKKTVRAWNKKYARLGTIDDNPFDTNLNGTVYQRMIQAAKTELKKGVKETPDGSNDSPDIARYRTAIAGNPGPGKWCAYFISYLAKQAGAPLGPNGSGFGLVDAMISYSKQKNQFIAQPGKARPGDIIFYNQHVGLVVDVNNKHVTTIEGNASNAVSLRKNREVGSIGLWRIPNKK